MGCCVSTEENKATRKQNQLHHHHHQHFPTSNISKSPPRPEEESVKEVLSETPKPKPRSNPLEQDLHPLELDQPTKQNLLLTPKKQSFNQKQLPIYPIKSPDPTGLCRAYEETEISDASEVSETVSTTTQDINSFGGTTEVVHKRSSSSLSQGQNGHFKNRAFSSGRSPARRPEPSPPRLRNPGPGSGQLRRVERRSRSPGTRGANVGRSPSARKTGPSPGRVRMVQEKERENNNVGNKRVDEEDESVRRRRENENDKEWEGPNESLENPLVSLECFIFL